MKVGDTHYQERVVRLSELVGDRMPPVIEGFTFDGCHIVGPAVVALEATSPGSGGMSNCTFDGEPDALFVQLAPEQEQVIGAVLLKDCQFDNCRFQGVGFLDKGRELRSRILDT
jgi:hypothetical protein